MAETGAVARKEQHEVEHSHAGRYLFVWLALIGLTFLTWALAQLHVGHGFGAVIALSIAAAKGSLVVLFFMHLWDQRGANRLVFVTSIVFVALLITLTIADNATRFPLANPPGSEGALPSPPAEQSQGPGTPGFKP